MNPTIKAQLFGSLGIESAEVLEQAELANVTEDDLPEENIEEESSVAEALEDTETDEEIENIEDQGDDLDNASESLEELDVATETFRASGGKFNTIEAFALKKTIAQITHKFVKNTDDVVPAIESFKKDNGDNTQLACEGIKEAAKAFKDGTVEVVRKAFETLKRVIGDLLNRFRGIEARANKVIVAAKQNGRVISGDIAVNKDSVSVAGDATFATIKAGFDRFNDSANKLENVKDIEQYDEIMKELNQPGEGKIKTETIIAAQNKFLEASFEAVFGESTEVNGSKQSKPFPGEYVAMLVKPESTIPFYYEAIGRQKPKEKGGVAKVTALQPDEIIAIATTVKALQKIMAKYKGLLRRLVTTMKTLNSVHATDPNRFENAQDLAAKDKEVKNAMGKGVRLGISKQMTFYSKLVSATNDISGNMLTLCEKSLASKDQEAHDPNAKKEEPKETPKKETAA